MTLDEGEEERLKLERLRRDIAGFERWNMLPDWKRVWFGELTHDDIAALDRLITIADDIPDLEKSIRLARNVETAGIFWRKGFLAFFGGILVLGPAIKLLAELFHWFSRKMGAP